MAGLLVLTLSLWTLWTWTSTIHGQVFTSEQEENLDAFVNTLMDCRGVPGLTMAVVMGNSTWKRGYGMADRETRRAVSTSTLFGIGSVTKAFTAQLLATLLDDSEGKYSWTTKVKDIFGEDFELANEEVTSHVTIKDILVHRTGLMTSNIPLFASLPASLTREEYVKRLRYLPAVTEFRDEWNYNNWMYTLAGRVAEVMGGASWEDLLLTRLLQPLNMTGTKVIGLNAEVYEGNFARPYVQVGEDVVLSQPQLYRIGPQEPAGAMASSADDMTKWILMLLNSGRTPEGDVIVNETLMSDMSTLHQGIASEKAPRNSVRKPQFPVTFSTFGYGYAWFSAIYRGYRVTWHSGGIFAYVTYLVLLPDLDIGFFVSTNGPGTGDASRTALQLFFYTADMLLGEEPWLNLTTACEYPAPWRPQPPAPPQNETIVPGGFDKPELYVGDFGNLLFGNVHIRHNGSDGLKMAYNRLRGGLFRTEEESVLMFEAGGALKFLSAGINVTHYFNVTFAAPAPDGKYQLLLISAPALGESEVLTFRRGVTFSGPFVADTNGQRTRFSPDGISMIVILCFLLPLFNLLNS